MDIPDATSSFRARRALLELSCAFAEIPTFRSLNTILPDNTAWLTMDYRPGGEQQLWEILKKCNGALNCPFYEGIVMKELNSPYPMQLRSDKEEFPFWVKHRWAF